MFIHDTLKIKYIKEGFLPDLPYHLISDEEMFTAFLTPDCDYNLLITDEYFNDLKSYLGSSDTNFCFYHDQYPVIDKNDEVLNTSNYNLIIAIQYHIVHYLRSPRDYVIPNWVYGYMIGSVIGPNSQTYDIHDLLVLMNMDNVDDEFNTLICKNILEISKQYVNKLKDSDRYADEGKDTSFDIRPLAFYGEPHIIKTLRLEQEGII